VRSILVLRENKGFGINVLIQIIFVVPHILRYHNFGTQAAEAIFVTFSMKIATIQILDK